MMKLLLLGLLMISMSTQVEDSSSYSNFNQIKQTEISINLKIDFDRKVLSGYTVLSLVVIEPNTDTLILDTMALLIHSVRNNNSGNALSYSFNNSFPAIGSGLIIKLERKYKKDERLSVVIYHSTTDEGEASQWLDKEMTAGKKFPFYYTQCESIFARSLIPCQDTPALKQVIKASLTVRKDLEVRFGGKYESTVDNKDGTKTNYFIQDVPIPTYLIAIAAGDIVGVDIGNEKIKSKIWAEPSVLECAKLTFEGDLPNFIQTANDYLFPYEWGTYDILVLPPAFPFGGMENPNLTFATPALLHCTEKNGKVIPDKSQIFVAAHELAHSWTGNLVTNANWNNFWLNESFTVYFERKIGMMATKDKDKGIDVRKLASSVSFLQLKKNIADFKKDGFGKYTRLNIDIQRNSPDDSFGLVPYEKGYNILYFLEQKVEEKNFDIIFKKYIETFKYKSVVYTDFTDLFEQQVREIFKDDKAKIEDILKSAEWDKWINEEGDPTLINDFSNDLVKEVTGVVDSLLKTKEFPDGFEGTFDKWNSQQQELFLNTIYDNYEKSKITPNNLDYLSDTLKLKDSDKFNMQIRYSWLLVELKYQNQNEDVSKSASEFVGKIGRMIYIRNIFRDWYTFDPIGARKRFNEVKSTYHPMCSKQVESDMANADKQKKMIIS